MCTILIRDLFTDNDYPAAGSLLYKKLVAKIDDEKQIILDMTGVDGVPSLFLNTSIGRFIETYGFDKLKSKVSFTHITASQAERIKEYISIIRK